MTQGIVIRVPSGGSSSRTLYNIEENDDKVKDKVGLDSGLQGLAASVKEDFTRLNSNNSGLDLVVSEQVKLFTYILKKMLLFPTQKEEVRFSPVIFASPQLGKKVQAG